MRGKWTPGPWSVDDTCFDRRIPIRGGKTAFGRPYNVALVNRPDSALAGQDKANAYLIAAAPALYEALERLIPTNVNLDHPGLADDVVVPCDVTLGELRAARAALSLAHPQPKGEEA